MSAFKDLKTDNSLKDDTGDDIGGAEVDANPDAIMDGLDGTTSVAWGDSGTITFGGSYSKGAWGLNGVDFRASASTFTDSGTAESGTATNAVAWSWARPTFAATNSSATMTNAATMYIANAPAAGTNVTLTNAYALWVDAGAVRFDGILNLDGSVDADVTDVDILSSGDIDLTSTSNAADAIYLRTNAGTSETIKIHADQGTSVTEGASSVQLLSDAGGVELKSTANLAKSIKLIADGGTSETIYIQADQGTSESSIQLVSDAGGIDIDAATGKNVDIAGGQINLTSSDDAASAIYLRANAGTSETIKIHADQGSGAGSITLVSDAGGIDVDAAGGVTIDSSGGTLSIGNDNVDQVVNLATAGTRTLNVGINDGTDVTTIVSKGNITNTGTLTVGVNDTGYDVQFFGAASGAYMLWDESANALDVRGATAAGAGTLKLTTGELTVVDGDVLGRIDFQAPLESDGTDAILVGASIWAEADDAFATGINDTDLVFAVAESETAAERMRLSYDGTAASLALTGATVMTLADGSITDSSGAITFGNENLSTTGTFSSGIATVGGIDLGTTGNRIDLDTNNDTSIRCSANDTLVLEIGASDRVIATYTGSGAGEVTTLRNKGVQGHVSGGLAVSAAETGAADTFIVTMNQSASWLDTGNTSATGIIVKLAGRYTANGAEGFFKEWYGYLGWSATTGFDGAISETATLGDTLKSNLTAGTPTRSAASQQTITFTNAHSAAFVGVVSVELTSLASDVTITVANDQ